jgi:cytochrome c biogenesis protein CcdA
MHKQESCISRCFGKTGWFYVGSFVCVNLAVTAGRLILGELNGWGWVELRVHVVFLVVVSAIVTMGTFAAFDLAEGSKCFLDKEPRPGPLGYFSAGTLYALVMVSCVLLARVIPGNWLAFVHIVSVASLWFLLPWTFIIVLARRVKRTKGGIEGL